MAIEIYTDGAAQGNPGKGGYGVVLLSGTHKKELSKGYKLTTNNRMELLACIVGLEALLKPGSEVTVYSDSQYVVNAIEKRWIYGWIAKKFKDKANQDLWLRFMNVYRKHQVKLIWVKGHNGNLYNERCDFLATSAAQGNDLEEDHGYLTRTSQS